MRSPLSRAGLAALARRPPPPALLLRATSAAGREAIAAARTLLMLRLDLSRREAAAVVADLAVHPAQEFNDRVPVPVCPRPPLEPDALERLRADLAALGIRADDGPVPVPLGPPDPTDPPEPTPKAASARATAEPARRRVPASRPALPGLDPGSGRELLTGADLARYLGLSGGADTVRKRLDHRRVLPAGRLKSGHLLWDRALAEAALRDGPEARP